MDKFRAIVVDDEASVCEAVKAILESEGIEAVSFTRSKDALETIRNENFDLVITDLKMPEMDGMDLYRRIAQRYPALRGRVVLVTGDTLSPSTAEFLQETGAPTVRKPFSARDLRSAVQTAREGRPPAKPPLGEATRPD